MKFRKPQWSGATAGRVYFDACMKLISDLPDEFEIVPGGHVCVKWPEGWTREYLLRSSRGEYGDGVSLRAWLEALAAIAPEPKKRKVELWKHKEGSCIWRAEGEWRSGDGWRKVAGPIEIED